MQPNDIDKLKKQCKMTRIAGWFFLETIFIYGFIVFVFVQRPHEPTMVSDAAGAQKYLYYILSIGSCLMIPVLKPMIISGHSLPKEYREVKLNYSQLTVRLVSATIVSYALAEIPVIFGIILSLSTHRMADFYILAALSFGALLVSLPKYEEWEAQVKKLVPF